MLGTGYNLDGVRILIVEGRRDDYELYEIVFTSCGADITIATAARDALEMFDRVGPHVVIVDTSLPDDDHVALARRVRAPGAEIPAVALSSRTSDRDRWEALAAGFEAYMPKPVEPAALVALVAELLRLPGPSTSERP